MSDDLNSLYDPWSREFGEYVIVFQGFDFYVCCRFLVSSLSFSKENSLYQNPTALPRLLFTSVNFDHTSYGAMLPLHRVNNPRTDGARFLWIVTAHNQSPLRSSTWVVAQSPASRTTVFFIALLPEPFRILATICQYVVFHPILRKD